VLEKREEMCSSGSSRRGCTVAAPVFLSYFSYKYRGEHKKQEADERTEKNKKRERRIAEKEENRGRERESNKK
jgi:hypothetical protein